MGACEFRIHTSARDESDAERIAEILFSNGPRGLIVEVCRRLTECPDGTEWSVVTTEFRDPSDCPDHGHPSSLAARLIELGRLHIRELVATKYDGELREAVFQAEEAVRAHPDFRPDQKEGTNDAN